MCVNVQVCASNSRHNKQNKPQKLLQTLTNIVLILMKMSGRIIISSTIMTKAQCNNYTEPFKITNMI